MNNFTINAFTSLIDELKYNKDGSIEVKFIKEKVLELQQKILKIDNNSTLPSESIEDILNSIKEITSYEPYYNLIYTKGYINLDNKNIIKIFGTEKLNINHYYKIKENIIITEFSEKVCIANPNIYAIKNGTILKVIKYTHNETNSHIVLQVRNVNNILERNSLY